MTKHNEELIAQSISAINDTILYEYSDRIKLLILSNLILNISTNYFPSELKNQETSVAADGKSVAYELMKHVDNTGLNLAIKAHHIIDLSNRVTDD